MTKIKIGTSINKQALWQAEYTQAALARIGQESEIVQINTPNPSVVGSVHKAIADALLRGEVDVAVYALDEVSIQQPEGLVITAVSQREDPVDWLVLRKEAFVSTEIFKVKKGGVLGAASKAQKAQMLDYRPDVQITDLLEDSFLRLEKLHAGNYDAIFLAAVDVKRLSLDLSDFEIVVLNPREFVPGIGQGVLAWQCNRDDLATRRIFKQIHHSEVSACTNIERKVRQLMESDSLAVHCARDAGGNFHINAAYEINGEMRRKHLSSSTSIGVAEKIVAGLKS